jgi:predicted metal-dependent enzyme (double-stranded beta helix superfamily)
MVTCVAQFAVEVADRRGKDMNTITRPASGVRELLGARQLADIVRRVGARQAEWFTRVRLNPSGRWYEQVHLDDSYEVWLISWLPGQETGFHDHGGASGAFTVVLGTLMESRVTSSPAMRQALRKPEVLRKQEVARKPVGAGEIRSFGPNYIHNVHNVTPSSLAVSVHAYSPPLSAMTRYEMTPSGLVTVNTEAASAWTVA